MQFFFPNLNCELSEGHGHHTNNHTEYTVLKKEKITKGTSMYYVITKGGGVGRKWQFLITFSTESNHKGGRGGVKKWQFLITFSTESNHKGGNPTS